MALKSEGRPQSELMKIAVTLTAIASIAQIGSRRPVAAAGRPMPLKQRARRMFCTSAKPTRTIRRIALATPIGTAQTPVRLMAPGCGKGSETNSAAGHGREECRMEQSLEFAETVIGGRPRIARLPRPRHRMEMDLIHPVRECRQGWSASTAIGPSG